jgi:hypothetical protein
MQRRSFLIASFGALAYRKPFVAPRAAARELRIAAIAGDAADTRKGMDFGLAEARKSGALFGWTVAVEHEWQNAHAILMGTTGRLPNARAPIVRVVADAGATGDGSFMVAPDPRSAGVAWRDDLERFGAQQLNDRYRAATGSTMGENAWCAWFGAKVIVDIVLRAGGTEPDRLLAHLRAADTHFDGHKGVPLRFGPDGRLIQPLYERRSSAAPGA